MTDIKLPVFTPRGYQVPPMAALDSGIRNVILCFGRRTGKDVLCMNHIGKTMCKEVGVYFYILPTYAQGKKVIWDSITNEGLKMLDYIPPEMYVSKNSQEMKLILKNGSVFQVIGSNNYDSLMGSNPRGIVFSEMALSDPQAFEYMQPILAANPKAWQIVNSTPRGKNFFYDLYNYAKRSDHWYSDFKTSIETGVVDQEFIDRELDRGVSEEHIQQEYFCNFSRGIEGTYYGRLVDKAFKEDRICFVPTDPNLSVRTSWDLGMRDSTAIIFYQRAGLQIRIIDCYENQGEGLSHYVNVLRRKAQENNWIYESHFAPHDIEVRDLSVAGITRREVARKLGIDFQVVKKIPFVDGIEMARGIFHKVWFNKPGATPLVKALENYTKAYNSKLNVYSERPIHDWSSHYADAFRYLATGEQMHGDGAEGLSADEWRDVRRRSHF